MEPHGGGAPNFEGTGPPAPENLPGQEQTAEAPPARPEQVGKRPPTPALPTVPDDLPVADQPVIAAPSQNAAAPIPTDPKAIAADTDNIEREWVDKVKNIIAHTQDDPHLQKEQMSRIKAEYIQKRFNKTIKTDEAAV
jgi:hypothetical protein